MTSFDAASAIAVRSVDQRSGVFAASVPDDWAQGRTAFGGLAGAMLVNAVLALPGARGRPIRSVDVAFIGPLPAGPAEVTARILREGKYLTHAVAELRAEGAGEPAASAHLVAGDRRSSGPEVRRPVPDPPPLESGTLLPFIPGVTPVFTQHLEFRYVYGFPFTGSADAKIGGYCRHRTPAAGVPALAGLVDGWPAAVLPLMTGPAPASSVRWSMHVPDDGPFDGDEWHWYQADTMTAEGGYASCTAELWRGDRLAAWSEQLVTVFEPPAPA